MSRINEIIKEFKEKNYQSFNEFYSSTCRLVYYMIAKIIYDRNLIEDLMQDTYVKFLENVDNIVETMNPTGYLAQIARNIAINEINRNKRVELNDEYVHSLKDDKSIDVGPKISLGIIDYLDGDDHDVVTMHIIGEMKFKDIANVLNKPLGTILWIYNRAIKKIRRKVTENNEMQEKY